MWLASLIWTHLSVENFTQQRPHGQRFPRDDLFSPVEVDLNLLNAKRTQQKSSLILSFVILTWQTADRDEILDHKKSVIQSEISPIIHGTYALSHTFDGCKALYTCELYVSKRRTV